MKEDVGLKLKCLKCEKIMTFPKDNKCDCSYSVVIGEDGKKYMEKDYHIVHDGDEVKEKK